MKKKIILCAIAGLSIGSVLSGLAMSNTSSQANIAVVNPQTVVAASKDVTSLKTKREKEIKKLATYLEKAKTNIENEQDINKRKALEEKYNENLNTKKITIEKKYTKKLKYIDKKISDAIAKTALKSNYNIVLSKNGVLYGGDDITDNVLKSIK